MHTLFYTNPAKDERNRNVGIMLATSKGEQELAKLIPVMKKHGHDPVAHNIRITDARQGRYGYGTIYIRGVAKYE